MGATAQTLIYRRRLKRRLPFGGDTGALEGFLGFSDTFGANSSGAETLVGGANWGGDWILVEQTLTSHIAAFDPLNYTDGAALSIGGGCAGLPNAPEAYS